MGDVIEISGMKTLGWESGYPYIDLNIQHGEIPSSTGVTTIYIRDADERTLLSMTAAPIYISDTEEEPETEASQRHEESTLRKSLMQRRRTVEQDIRQYITTVQPTLSLSRISNQMEQQRKLRETRQLEKKVRRESHRDPYQRAKQIEESQEASRISYSLALQEFQMMEWEGSQENGD